MFAWNLNHAKHNPVCGPPHQSGHETMSRIAYLVFAYKNPQLLKRAIKTLSTEHCAFFVHIDQKVDIGQFSSISGDNVFFTDKRVVVYWGEFSGIEAILLLIGQALDRPERYDH